MTQTQPKLDTEKLLQTFLELVRLDSPSGHEEPVRLYLEDRFKQLGIAYTVDASENLIVSIPGHNCATDATLVLTGHMDVVPPCIGVKPIVEGEGLTRSIRSSGDTVLGADDKSGLAPMLEALEYSLQHGTSRPNLLYLITVREEVMLSGAHEMSPEAYRHADFAIAFDHTGEQGTLIHEAPTYIKFTLKVHGKSVHAGIMPEKGINAIHILSQVVEKLHLGRVDENTTCNIGFIKGGKATNIVPDLAVAEGELRGHDPETMAAELAYIESTFNRIVAQNEGASGEFTHETSFEHYRTEPDDPRLQKVVSAMTQLGLDTRLIRTNGGSDINVFANKGVPGVVLSAGYIHPHSQNEHVYLKDMLTITELILKIWEQFAA